MPEPALLPKWQLDTRHSASFLRLLKQLQQHRGFRFIPVVFNDPAYRDRLIAHIAHCLDKSTEQIDLSQWGQGFDELLSYLKTIAISNTAVHLTHYEDYQADKSSLGDLFYQLNYRRETFAEQAPCFVLLWLTATDTKQLALKAPDLWNWRYQSFDFSIQKKSSPLTELTFQERENLDVQASKERLESIAVALERLPLDDQGRPGLLEEKANLEYRFGDWQSAEQDFDNAITLYEASEDKFSAANTMRQRANLYQSIGKIDQALAELQSALTLFDQLKANREHAITLGDIARIKVSKGEVDDALALHQQRIQVFEALGDQREKALALGDIARIKASKGQIEEALDLYQQELEVMEALGDQRSRAFTLGGIAHIKFSKGEVDDALALHQQEIEVYEALGDQRSRAITLDDIARIKSDKGQINEAITLYQESLDMVKKLGDLKGIAIVGNRFGQILVDQQDPQAKDILQISQQAYQKLGKQEDVARLQQIIEQIS